MPRLLPTISDGRTHAKRLQAVVRPRVRRWRVRAAAGCHVDVDDIDVGRNRRDGANDCRALPRTHATDSKQSKVRTKRVFPMLPPSFRRQVMPGVALNAT